MSTSTTGERRRTFAIPCSAPGCRQWTSEQAPANHWLTAQDAVHAAIALGWIHVRETSGRHVWVCPRHQVWDPHHHRWVYDRGDRA